ncbi:MAG: hypothetical protein IJY86_11920 [Clostridia bacterium]|nr:hypothetical protein [Clostridia bacterium]
MDIATGSLFKTDKVYAEITSEVGSAKAIPLLISNTAENRTVHSQNTGDKTALKN